MDFVGCGRGTRLFTWWRDCLSERTPGNSGLYPLTPHTNRVAAVARDDSPPLVSRLPCSSCCGLAPPLFFFSPGAYSPFGLISNTDILFLDLFNIVVVLYAIY